MLRSCKRWRLHMVVHKQRKLKSADSPQAHTWYCFIVGLMERDERLRRRRELYRIKRSAETPQQREVRLAARREWERRRRGYNDIRRYFWHQVTFDIYKNVHFILDTFALYIWHPIRLLWVLLLKFCLTLDSEHQRNVVVWLSTQENI